MAEKTGLKPGAHRAFGNWLGTSQITEIADHLSGIPELWLALVNDKGAIVSQANRLRIDEEILAFIKEKEWLATESDTSLAARYFRDRARRARLELANGPFPPGIYATKERWISDLQIREIANYVYSVEDLWDALGSGIRIGSVDRELNDRLWAEVRSFILKKEWVVSGGDTVALSGFLRERALGLKATPN